MTPQTTYREARAARRCARRCDARRTRVFLMGEDVGRYGGCFAVSQGPARGVRPGADPRHAAVGVGLRRRRHRRGAGRDAADRRDHDRQLQPAGARPDRQQRRHAAAHVGRPVQRAARDPHGHRRRPPARRAALAQPRGLVRPHPGAARSWRPATLEDARGMLWPRAAGPGPGADLRARRALHRGGRARRRRRRRSTSTAPPSAAPGTTSR